MRELTEEEEAMMRQALFNSTEPIVPLPEWHLIETAPRDGTPVLLGWDQGFHAMDGHCEGGVWGDLTSDFDFEPFQIQPTHWMPMPQPPART